MYSVFDVASFAENLGYNYNQVIEMMERDKIIPFYEKSVQDAYKGIGNSYGWSDELCEIFDAFVAEFGDQKLTD